MTLSLARGQEQFYLGAFPSVSPPLPTIVKLLPVDFSSSYSTALHLVMVWGKVQASLRYNQFCRNILVVNFLLLFANKVLFPSIVQSDRVFGLYITILSHPDSAFNII